MKTKRCPHCGVTKTSELFPVARRRFDGLGSWCKACVSDWSKKNNQRTDVKARNRKRAIKAYHDLTDEEKRRRNGSGPRKEGRMMRLYQMTLNDYEILLEAQGGVCNLCGNPPKQNRLAVDHDHACCPGEKTCGKCVRGLLCTPCNLALGRVEDEGWMERADAHLNSRPRIAGAA